MGRTHRQKKQQQVHRKWSAGALNTGVYLECLKCRAIAVLLIMGQAEAYCLPRKNTINILLDDMPRMHEKRAYLLHTDSLVEKARKKTDVEEELAL